MIRVVAVLTLPLLASRAWSQERPPLVYDDPQPKLYTLSERASVIDSRVKAHPEINFPIEKDGRFRDNQSAAVDTRVKPRGKLVLGGSGDMSKIATGLGFHWINVPYATGWFNLFNRGEPKDTWRGDIRLEAVTGEDHSKLVDIPKADCLMERSYQFVKWLAKNNPQGKWDYFLTADGKGLRWEDVIVVGLSHTSTTAARFAQHTKLDRVLCFSGPRDQDQSWQQLPSATPPNRFFCFTHVLDGGWVANHYCRSWEMLGLHKCGPIVDVEKEAPPYKNTRRLITTYPEKASMRVHNGVAPTSFSFRNEDKSFVHEPVWRYMLTHPVDVIGEPTALDPACQKKK